jgi:hypothetical protein
MQTYIDGVLNRARHHAHEVEDVIPALRGFVELYADEIHLRGNGLVNVSWFRSAATGRRYAFSYSHSLRKVELRENSLRGPVIARFHNDSGNSTIHRLFRSL